MKYINIILVLLQVFILNQKTLWGTENDSTVVLDSIAYRIWTDTTHYSIFDIIPINFEYVNIIGDTLHFISTSGNIVWLSFTDTLGNEFLHNVVAGSSHYWIPPYDTLTFSDTAALDIEWNPGTYIARGVPDIWNATLPFAEIIVNIESYISINDEVSSPKKLVLFHSYPNPFNTDITIEFSLPTNSLADLIVYDVMGHKVESILSQKVSAGTHYVIWNGRNVSSGIYYFVLKGDNFHQTRKALLLK